MPVVVSGSDATDHPEIYLRRGAAAVILGEGEVTLADLVDRMLTRGGSTRRRAGHRATSTTQRRGQPNRAAAVRQVARRAAVPGLGSRRRRRYRRIWQQRHGYYSMNLATTRGCPYHCNWCAKPIYGQRYAVRSPQASSTRSRGCARDFAPDHLSIVDDVFGLQPGWIEEFATLVAEQGAPLPFRCLMRADQVTADVARALAAAGCRMVWMGAESGSQRILDAMEKGVRVEQIRDGEPAAASRPASRSASSCSSAIPARRGTTSKRRCSSCASSSRTTSACRCRIRCRARGSTSACAQELGPKQNWVDSSDLAMMYRATYAPEFYRVLHDVVHHEFRARQVRATR